MLYEIKLYKVYALLNPFKKGPFLYDNYSFEFEPFYIGMTRNIESRFFEHIELLDGQSRNDLKDDLILEIIWNGEIPLLDLVLSTNDVQEAATLENELIIKIGMIRNKEGPLTNKTYGGGGFYGVKLSEEYKKEQSKKIKQTFKNNQNLAETHSKIIIDKYKSNPEIKIQISNKVKQLWKNDYYRIIQTNSHKQAYERDPSLKNKCCHNRKNWIVIDPSGQELVVGNLPKFCRDNDIVYNTFITKQDTHKSWNGWKLKNIIKEGDV